MENIVLPSLSTALKQNGLWAKKSLGQHFLLNESFCHKIAALAGSLDKKNVVEVGPGPGGLSRAIISAHPLSFTMIEMDTRFRPLLSPLLIGKHINILWQDALKIDIASLFPDKKTTLLSNLPYNIGTPLLINWLKNIHHFEFFVLMFQKEVALRICALAGEKHYGRLSVMTNWLCETHLALHVPPGAFTPPPQIDSAVITITPREKPLGEVEVSFKAMEFIVGKAFGLRRKMLKRSLKDLNFPWDILEINANLRPENLEITDFCKIAKYWEDNIQKQ